MAHFDYNRIKVLRKDQIIAEFIPMDDGRFNGNIKIVMPDNYTVYTQIRPAKVLHVGTKFRFKDDVKVGDTVWVPVNFGTTLNQDLPLRRVFDGEDVYCKLVEE